MFTMQKATCLHVLKKETVFGAFGTIYFLKQYLLNAVCG
jgi:hypothetical protein